MAATDGATRTRAPGTSIEAAARARQVVIDLLLHRGDLASHRPGQLRGAVRDEPIDLVRENAQRSLQAMREIAGLDAPARHDFLVALEERVEIVDQGLGLGRK